MNFDFGDVFRYAWQITWKHKIIWLITALPFLLSLLFLPIWLVLVFTRDFDPGRLEGLIETPGFLPLVGILYLVFFVLSILLQVLSWSSATLGIYRAEMGIQPVALGDLLRNGFHYFWRILGVLLSISAAFVLFFIAFNVVTMLLSAVTMGLAAICLQPLFLLMIPLMLLVMAVMEQAQVAVVADGMGVWDALKQGYELVRANFGKYILITLVIYIGINILFGLVIFPVMLPMSFFMVRNMKTGLDFSNMLRMQAAFGVVLFPLMALIQGVAWTYMKSAMIVVYLRLTRPSVAPRIVLAQAIV